MTRRSRSRGATYVVEEDSLLTRQRSFFKSFLLLTVCLFLLTGLLSLGTHDFSSSAQAIVSSESDEEGLSEALNEGEGYSPTDEGFDSLMEDLEDAERKDEEIDGNSILYAFKRHFTIGYMNEGDKAEIGSDDSDDNSLDWYEDIFNARGQMNCGKSWQGRGTALDGDPAAPPYYPGEEEGSIFWHNCDVPNLVTEFAQDMVSVFVGQGIQGGEVRNVATRNRWFGYPYTMPEDVVRNGSEPVTALEAFGYSLRYTSYMGEWDHIKVMTAARALSNFGFLDRLKLSAQAVVNGITGGVESAVNSLVDDLKSGNIVRIITSPQRIVTSFFGGGSAAAVDTIIDTSDTNVFSTISWYRPNFGETLYNARQLSQEEISVYVEQQLIQYLEESASDLEKAKPPADLAAIDPAVLDRLPKPDPGKCSGTYTARKPGLTQSDPDEVATGSVPNNSSATETETVCRNYVLSVARGANPGFTVSINSLTYEPSRTVGEWSDEAGWEGPVEKYQIFCALDLSNPQSTDPAPVNSFLVCLRNPKAGWPAAVARETRNEQVVLNNNWYAGLLEQRRISEFFRKQSAAFTSANARYVCLNPDGSDMMKDGKYVKLVIGERNEQKMNPECLPVRKPIQNGLFGNGYFDNSATPTDTRREAFGFSFWDLISQDEVLSNAGLGVTVFMTRMSNTFLNLSFAPIMEAFGLDTIVTSLIIALRDSLFFPLSILIVAIAAISAFFSAGTKRDYGAQFRSLLMMAGLFVFGTILLTDPARTIRFVDEAPATVEAVIVGAVFQIDSPDTDDLCKAGVSTGPTGNTDSFGNQIKFDPDASVRNVLCENWKIFAFRPYIQGQWGTSYENLNLDNFRTTGAQADLVGDGEGDEPPFVGLGNGGQNAEYNWGLYQLDAITAGTVSQEDVIQGEINSRDLYRIVDLQAGPNGTSPDAPYADQYFEHWRGDYMADRIITSWFSASVAFVGAITMFFFAWAKIFISIVSVLMILFMPLMFLIGLFPGAGSTKLKGYFFQLLSLMVQRVVLTTMIALFLRVLTTVAQSTESYFLYTILTLVICIFFLLYRKEILGIFDKSIVGGSGGFGRNMKENLVENIPFGRSAQQQINVWRAQSTGFAYGAMGGFLNGGVSGAYTAAKGVSSRNKNMADMRNMMQGQGSMRTALKASDRAASEATENARGFMRDRLKPTLERQVREDFKTAGLSEDQITDKLVAEQVEKQLKALMPRDTGSRKKVQNMNRLRRAEADLIDPDSISTRDEVRTRIADTLASSELLEDDEVDEFLRAGKESAERARPSITGDTRKHKRYAMTAEAVQEDMEAAFQKTRSPNFYQRARGQQSEVMSDLLRDAEKASGEDLSPEERNRDSDIFTQAYLQESAKRMSRVFVEDQLDSNEPSSEEDRTS